jgi:hypothetical protein
MRRVGHTLIAAGLGLLLLACAGPGWAQKAYKCRKGDTVYYADKPCPEDAGAAGTVDAPAPPARVVDYRVYMRSECRSLDDAIRYYQDNYTTTRAATSVRRRELSRLRDAYQAECSEEEQLARQLAKVNQPPSASRDQRREELKAQRDERLRLEKSLAQCKDMRQVRESKRARLESMTAPERAEFEHFEANFAERCQGLSAP